MNSQCFLGKLHSQLPVSACFCWGAGVWKGSWMHTLETTGRCGFPWWEAEGRSPRGSRSSSLRADRAPGQTELDTAHTLLHQQCLRSQMSFGDLQNKLFLALALHWITPPSIATHPLHLTSLQQSPFVPQATELHFGSLGNKLLFIYFMCLGILPTYVSVEHVCALFLMAQSSLNNMIGYSSFFLLFLFTLLVHDWQVSRRNLLSQCWFRNYMIFDCLIS